MTAKTGYQRIKDYRARKKDSGESEVRGIFAPKHLHQEIREAVKALIKARK